MKETMYCNQCQETLKNNACTVKGMCGKTAEVAALQDQLIYLSTALATLAVNLEKEQLPIPKKISRLICTNLFITITNANFDALSIETAIKNTFIERDRLLQEVQEKSSLPPICFVTRENLSEETCTGDIHQTKDVDIKSLRELILYGLKGLCAYTKHAFTLSYEDEKIYTFIQSALAKTLDDTLSAEDLTAFVLQTGEMGVKAMALLDEANTKTYGNPQITEVNIGVRNNPGILISGHDLKDMEMLLEQTAGSGVDVYTHCEMLPANYYPAFQKYDHFVGNYGNAWWKQQEEFEYFHGPILMTTNCIVPVRESYRNRLFTTNAAGYPGCVHIAAEEDGTKDFSAIIELAKACEPPKEIERGKIVGGFAHAQVLQLADQVVAAVKSGAIKKFVVMAGCDGRQNKRNYYAEFAAALPKDTLILTAGCAKYRYNKLNLGDIGGIPRVLDAGQCNDSYSLALIAMKLQEVFQLPDINDLPIIYNIAWYEQKAVIVLLALLSLGVKNIHLGPTLPAFLSENVARILVENFGIAGIDTVENDIHAFFPNKTQKDSKLSFSIKQKTIGELLREDSSYAEILMNLGMHCLCCPSSQMETLEEACAVHGLNVEEVVKKLRE